MATIIYNIYDNNRVVAVKQQMEIENLPAEFEGFTILLLSDLHGKRFGENQEHLLALINSLQYDMLVIAGDMSDWRDRDNQPFYDLLDGIENKEYAYAISGNTGPWGFDTRTGILDAVGQTLEAKGVHNLNQVFSIQRGESRLMLAEFYLVDWVKAFYLDPARQGLKETALSPADLALYQNEEAYALDFIGDLEKITPQDTLIGVSHVPYSKDSVSATPEMMPPFDLILAGHYHGGQIRLPWIGAIYIPDGASETYGIFPSQDRVSGLYDWGAFQQYITRGLGASGSVPFLGFRLFNTPEINLITLVGKK